jgi:hypothetical protein
MSQLNQLLDGFAPPPVPEGLAARAAQAASKLPQERRALMPWRRGSARGGWRRGALIGSAAIGFAFTSAVAAEVVSGGRIEIPVVHQVVAAIPVLSRTHEPRKPVQLASRGVRPAPKPPEAAPPAATESPVTPRQRLIQTFAEAKKQVAERRAAGLPTPTADRIERKAKRIVERREAAGLPTPSLDEVELRVAIREWRTMRMLRQVARDPSGITDVQVDRFSRILPAQKREQFLALGPDQQRQLMGRAAQRFLARRMQRQAQNSELPQIAQQPSEGLAQPPR